MKSWKLLIVALVVAVVPACGNGNNKESGQTASNGNNTENAGKSVEIVMLNSKGQIHEALENAAQAFMNENSNIKVNILTVPSGQSPFERASVLYSSGTPATLNMLDAGDIAKFKDKALDLSGEKWVKDLAAPNELDGATLAFPFAVEGYGLVYNKAVVEKAIGGAFDPASVKTLADLESLFQTIEKSGISPILVGGMPWSLGNHFLPLSYAAQEGGDVAAFLASLKAGEANLADNASFNGLMDTFDLMKAYNSGKKDPLAVTAENIAAAVANGTSAFTFNGNWMISQLLEVNPDGEYAFLPVPIDNAINAKAAGAIAVGATKQIFIDKSESTPEQQAAAKQFLEWFVYNETGQDFLVNKMGIIPATSNNPLEPSDSLGKSIKSYLDSGLTVSFGANYVPGDHSKVIGASMQKYLADSTDRAGLAKEIEAFWKGKE
jgi:raffinose/stachyose/melibiose transport system substrate-binding protein